MSSIVEAIKNALLHKATSQSEDRAEISFHDESSVRIKDFKGTEIFKVNGWLSIATPVAWNDAISFLKSGKTIKNGDLELHLSEGQLINQNDDPYIVSSEDTSAEWIVVESNRRDGISFFEAIAILANEPDASVRRAEWGANYTLSREGYLNKGKLARSGILDQADIAATDWLVVE